MEAGRGKAEVGRRAGELMSFFEDAPSPPPAGFWTVGPSASLPVQVGTDNGTVSLPSALKMQLASFQQWSHPEKHPPPFFFLLSLNSGAASPGLSPSVPCILEYPH